VRGRRGKGLRRRRANRDVRKRLLVLCEGAVTEPGYLRDFAHASRHPQVHVRVEPCSDNEPLAVVNAAIAAKAGAVRAAKAERDDFLLYDEVWCVIDHDDHARLNDARALAGKHDIRLAVSNPCFELWALIHFRDQTAYADCQAVTAALLQDLPGYNKALKASDLASLYDDAVVRAAALRVARSRADDLGGNPSTDMDLLTRSIRSP